MTDAELLLLPAAVEDAFEVASVVCAARDTWLSWAGDDLVPQAPVDVLEDWVARISDIHKTTMVAFDASVLDASGVEVVDAGTPSSSFRPTSTGIVGVISYSDELYSSAPHTLEFDAGSLCAHLSMLFVSPMCQEHGVAAALHSHMLADMTVQGFSGVRLRVPAGAVQAREFYERRGWEPTGRPAAMRDNLLRVEYRRPLP